MQRLIILLFMLPWWAYVPIAGGVAYMGNEVYTSELRKEAEREAALELGVPDPVDLATFDRDVNIGPANEVNVLGWINTDYSYTLVKRTNGVKTSERYLYMVFGMSDDVTARTVRAAIVFSEAQKDYFVDHLDEYIVSYQKDAPLFRFGGIAGTSDSMAKMVDEAIAEQGLRKSDDFFYLEPFLAGREAALAPHGVPEQSRKQIWMIALGIALFGIAKRVFGWGRRPAGAAEPVDPKRAAQVQVPGGANKAFDYDYTFKAKRRDVELSKDIAPDSPLGRLALRNAPPPMPEAEPAVPRVSAESPAPDERKPARARPKGASMLSRAQVFFGLAICLAANGYFASTGSQTLSLPIRGYDPFAQPMPLFAAAGVLMLLSVVASVRSRKAQKAADRVEPVIPRVGEPPMTARAQPVTTVADRLSGSRAWVNSAGKGAPAAPNAVNADMQARLKSDPFDRFAEQARALR